MSAGCRIKWFFIYCLLATQVQIFAFKVDHPLFKELNDKGQVCLTRENQHQFLALEDLLIQKVKNLSRTKMHEVYELIHCSRANSFVPTPGAITSYFSLDRIEDTSYLSTVLNCSQMEPKFCGRTYFFRTRGPFLIVLSFQEEGPTTCKKIVFGPIDNSLVKLYVENIVDYLLEYDQSFLALPFKKMIQNRD